MSSRLIAPASAVTSPSLKMQNGTSPNVSVMARVYISLTFASNRACGTLRKSDAFMVRLLMYTPALDTPTASTRGICSAAVRSAATMPS